MIGCDIRDMTPETKEILTKKEIIAINQDPAQRQPFLACEYWGTTAWCKELEGGDLCVAIFDLQEYDITPFFIFSDIGLDRSCGVRLEITDLWTGQNYGVFRDQFRSPKVIKPHECMMLRCKIVHE